MTTPDHQPAPEKAPQSAQPGDRQLEPGDVWMTTREVSELLRVHVGTVRNWRCLGDGPRYFKWSPRCVRYRKSDVVAWAEREYVDPL